MGPLKSEMSTRAAAAAAASAAVDAAAIATFEREYARRVRRYKTMIAHGGEIKVDLEPIASKIKDLCDNSTISRFAYVTVIARVVREVLLYAAPLVATRAKLLLSRRYRDADDRAYMLGDALDWGEGLDLVANFNLAQLKIWFSHDTSKPEEPPSLDLLGTLFGTILKYGNSWNREWVHRYDKYEEWVHKKWVHQVAQERARLR
jgi:hypothetical protein